MAEIRISLRPNELNLLLSALNAVLKRCEWSLRGNGYAENDSRDWCIFSYARDEIQALKAKLQARGEQP